MTAVSDDRAPSTTGALLRAEGLVKHFPMRGKMFTRGERAVIRAVDGVSFAVATGETLGLVGESGSGKSTVARLVLRLMPLTGGAVEFDGNDITKAKASTLRDLRPGMQLVFQDPYSSFDPQATVVDSVIEPMIATGVDRKTAEARASDLFDLCGLSRTYLNRYPRELSGGQLQRGGIARALMTDPKLVVMDEPVSALDVSTQGQVINLLQDLQDELRVSFLFIAHDLAVVRHVSHRIAVMYLGQLVEEGTAQEIYEAPRHPYTQALLSAIPVPNPPVQRSRLRIILKGEIPSPANPPSGCRFRTRCPYVMDVCATEEPEEYVTADGHRSRCHLHVTGPAPLAGASVTTLKLPA